MFNPWLTVAAALVFFMQAGFLALECGLVREKNVKSVAFKNLIDCIIATLAFTMCGFALMFGEGAWVGMSFFGLENLPKDPTRDDPNLFALYQLGFAATTVTIVSGAIAGRAAFGAYVVISLVTSLLIYPIFGHWAWGDLLVADNAAWLSQLGFVDFAGSTVVHALGGFIGLTAAFYVGPRLGRFDGSAGQFIPSSYGVSALGVIILWFGWFGFNGGSVGSDLSLVGPVIIHTCLAAAAAGSVGYGHAVVLQKRADVPEKLVGATLAGLVAITACCHVVRPWTAIVVGAVAALLHNWSFELLKRRGIDDAVGVFPVHAVGGVWGTLAVALVGRAELLPRDRFGQLGVQLLGVTVCAVWAIGTSAALLFVIKKTMGLRVSPEEEIAGVSIAGEHAILPAEPALTEHELLELLGGDG